MRYFLSFLYLLIGLSTANAAIGSDSCEHNRAKREYEFLGFVGLLCMAFWPIFVGCVVGQRLLRVCGYLFTLGARK